MLTHWLLDYQQMLDKAQNEVFQQQQTKIQEQVMSSYNISSQNIEFSKSIPTNIIILIDIRQWELTYSSCI